MADGGFRPRITVEEIDQIRSHAQRKIILYMRRDMTKNDIVRALLEEDDVRLPVANHLWAELEPLNKEYFAAYRARLAIHKPSGSLSQTGAPRVPRPPINWKQAVLPLEPLVQPWSQPQGPSNMEDPSDILDHNLTHNRILMHGADPYQDFDFSGIFLEPTVNPSESLSDLRADIPVINGTDIVDIYYESSSSVQQQVNVENMENMSESESDESDGNSGDSYVSTGRNN